MESSSVTANPILHVVVVGFHHKKGCQVEYSYPPLLPGKSVDSSECPDEWRQLPSLALPDGAHNFNEDTIFFHLPSRELPRTTVFGVSCYRQMLATDVLNPSADLTRNSVQKSVCVLSKLPLYGIIQAKLELITHAYFLGRDFSQVTLLEETYNTLNGCINESLLRNSQAFVGMSCREILQKFQHKLLILFKLILLERRVLLYSSPVKSLCSSILTLMSLFPGMVERGLTEASSYVPSKPMSPTVKVPKVTGAGCDLTSVSRKEGPVFEDCSEQTSSGSKMKLEGSAENFDSLSTTQQLNFIECQAGTVTVCSDLETSVLSEAMRTLRNDATLIACESPPRIHSMTSAKMIANGAKSGWSADSVNSNISADTSHFDRTIKLQTNDKTRSCGGDSKYTHVTQTQVEHSAGSERDDLSVESEPIMSHHSTEHLLEADDDISHWEADQLMLEINDALNDNALRERLELPDVASGIHSSSRKLTVLMDDSEVDSKKIFETCVSTLETDDMGFPLSIFTKRMLLHPYLSLHLYDLLTDVNVRGLVFGATNGLFRQKTQLVDVIVEITDAKIEIHDAALKRQLTLTTADLRFADHLVKSISDEKGDIFLDTTEWEGGDDWLRAQFKAYLVSLLHTVSFGEERQIEDFNSSFVLAWKTTHNYRVWRSSHQELSKNIQLGHPFRGQLAMSDVKLRLSQVVQNADHNKKITAVVSETGRVVTQTGKAVGGAITSAKSAVSSWLGTFGSSKN